MAARIEFFNNPSVHPSTVSPGDRPMLAFTVHNIGDTATVALIPDDPDDPGHYYVSVVGPGGFSKAWYVDAQPVEPAAHRAYALTLDGDFTHEGSYLVTVLLADAGFAHAGPAQAQTHMDVRHAEY